MRFHVLPRVNAKIMIMRGHTHWIWVIALWTFACVACSQSAPPPEPYAAFHEELPGFSVMMPGQTGFSAMPGLEWAKYRTSATCTGKEPWSDPCEKIFIATSQAGLVSRSADAMLLVQAGSVSAQGVQGGLKAHMSDFTTDPVQEEADKGASAHGKYYLHVTARTAQPDQSPGADCLKTSEEMKFAGGGSLFGLYPSFIFTSAYLCSHPDKADYLVRVECAQFVSRYDGPDQGIAMECEAFLASLSFRSLH